jgi:hypothetical protein
MDTGANDVFSMSDSFIAKVKRFNWSFYLSLLFALFLGFVYMITMTTINGYIIAGVIVGFAVFFSLIFFVSYSNAIRQYRAMRIVVHSEGFIREFRGRQERLYWQDIEKVRIDTDRTGEVVGVLITTTKRGPIVLAGFENLTMIIAKIREYLTVPFEEKKVNVDLTAPIMPWVYIGGSIFFVSLLFFIGGRDALAYVQLGTQIFLALIFLFAKPISRFNVNYSRLEKIVGIMYIVIIIMQLLFILA